VAKIDTGKSDIFASYPMLQLFMEPSFPNTTSGAKALHIYIGAGVGSFISLIILVVLWVRRRSVENGLVNPSL